MALTKYEQETVVTMNREDDYAVIFTRNARHIRMIAADDRFEVQSSAPDENGAVEELIAHIKLDNFDAIKGLKRRQKELTPEQRAKRDAALAAARAARNA